MAISALRVKKLNRIIGHGLRWARILRGLTLTRLADEIGVTLQQIQEYENGRNSIIPVKLLAIAKALGVSVSCFFDAPNKDTPDSEPPPRRFLHLAQVPQQVEKRHPEKLRAVYNMVAGLED